MDATSAVWTVGFPLLLFFIAVAAGVAFAMTSSDSIGFLVAKVCFAAAAFDCVAFAIYWVLATRQSMPWNIGLPMVTAIIVVPALVLSLQWLSGIEIRLSTHLIPGNNPTPKLPITAEIPTNALRVLLRTNVAWATKMPHTVLMMGGEKMIEIDRDKSSNELVVSVLRIFDDRNNIIARIDTDGFWVKNSTRNKRPDQSTLVVYDHLDAEVLRIVFLNPTTLSITGVFRHAGIARAAIVTPEYMDIGGIRLSGNVMGEAGLADIAIGDIPQSPH